MTEQSTNDLKQLGIYFINAFLPLFIIFIVIILIYFCITFIWDYKKDYEKKHVKSVKYHDKTDYCDYIVVYYRIWERKKIKYLKNYYHNGNKIPFNRGNYVVTNLYPKNKVKRKKFFILNKRVNCWFKRCIYAYVRLV